ncbi:MAG TPA: hypothetical protein VKT49_24000 [Bryobacteraceae bacterium]|nr:hypothetical protein [Bryobacteraceae bacterium]
MKITRRQLASALAAGAALAQTPPQPRTPEAELQAARDQLKATLARLSAQAVPMSTEPAFQFKA